ncbi:MAG: CHAT domain-containing protein, partial [Gemmataceae bacterium]|nr:CHAT domain-containing protein [Gemmataceae bacterium]
LPLLREALPIREAVLGRHPELGNNLNSLALVLSETGEPQAALRLHLRALEVRRETLGPRHAETADSLSGLGDLLRRLGRPKEAKRLLEQALAIHREAGGPRHPDCATDLGHLGSLHHAAGDHEAARRCHEEALSIRREALGERHVLCAASQSDLATELNKLGEHEKALSLSEQALALVSDRLRENASVQSDRQQLASAAAFRVFLSNRFGMSDDGSPAAATHVLAWKGALLARQQQRRLFLRLAADPETRAVAARLQEATRRLAALRQQGGARRALAALERVQDEAQAELSRRSAAFRAAKAAPTADDLAQALPEGAVLLDYFFFGPRKAEALAVIVHRRGERTERINLGRALPIEEAIADWRAGLLRGKGDGRAVRKLLLEHVEKRLEGAKLLLVSPDRMLGTVPWAALPGKKAGTYLVEDLPVAIVPAAQLVPGLLGLVGEKDRLGPSLLAVGDLRYGTGGRFEPLPATKAEAEETEASFKAAFEKEAVSLRQGEATKKAVRDHLPKVRCAHFATHGFFAAGSKEERNPLLLSGLALSDANRVPKEGEEDGILTALEVSGMDLTRLELAVLSACETGLGKAASEEGLLGLQRAFHAAGARSVVSWLWSVDDEATRALMADFYAQLWRGKGIGKAEALRRAQLAMLFGKTLEGKPRGAGVKPEKLPRGEGERRHPYTWAAFVLSGDWR